MCHKLDKGDPSIAVFINVSDCSINNLLQIKIVSKRKDGIMFKKGLPAIGSLPSDLQT